LLGRAQDLPPVRELPQRALAGVPAARTRAAASSSDRGEPVSGALASRREFLCAVAGCAAAAAGSCSDIGHTPWFRKRFRELSKAEVAEVLADLEKEHSAKYGKPVTVGAEEPRPDVEFGYALDISRCVGCRRCVYACVAENNQSRDPQIHWIRMLE